MNMNDTVNTAGSESGFRLNDPIFVDEDLRMLREQVRL